MVKFAFDITPRSVYDFICEIGCHCQKKSKDSNCRTEMLEVDCSNYYAIYTAQ